MNRFEAIAAIVVVLILAALYAGGYWYWVLPCRIDRVITQQGKSIYGFDDTWGDRLLSLAYSPVFYCEGAVAWFHPRGRVLVERIEDGYFYDLNYFDK